MPPNTEKPSVTKSCWMNGTGNDEVKSPKQLIGEFTHFCLITATVHLQLNQSTCIMKINLSTQTWLLQVLLFSCKTFFLLHVFMTAEQKLNGFRKLARILKTVTIMMHSKIFVYYLNYSWLPCFPNWWSDFRDYQNVTHQLGLSLSAIALGMWRCSRLIAWRLAYQPVVTNVIMEMELISFQSEQNKRCRSFVVASDIE